MTITIRDPKLVEMIGEASKRTGETPDGLIARLVSAEMARRATSKAHETDLLALVRGLNRAYGPTPEAKPSPAETWRIQQELFDYLNEEPLR